MRGGIRAGAKKRPGISRASNAGALGAIGTPARLAVLKALATAPGEVSTRALMAASGMSVSSANRTVNRMVALGLAVSGRARASERGPDGCFYRATDAGRAAWEAAKALGG